MPGATPEEAGEEGAGLPVGATAAALELPVEVYRGAVKLVPGARGVAKVVRVLLAGTAAAELLELAGAGALCVDVN